MPATDEQIAALHAQLSGSHDEHRRIIAELDSRGALAGYTAVVTAAFIEAVDRRFGPHGVDDAAVIEFVGEVRSRFPGADEEIDPLAAERVVRKALGRGSISDLDGATIRRIEALLLPVLVADEHLDDQGLNQFLAAARKLLES